MGYLTIVFEYEGNQPPEKLRKLSHFSNGCCAWSTDHELSRLSLIENALENGDPKRAERYLSLSGDDLKKELDLVFKEVNSNE